MNSSLLFAGNSKTGKGVLSFSLPRGPDGTCVGATELCKKHCYAKRFVNRFAGVDPAYQARWEASEQADFVDRMVEEIKDSGTKVVRVHVCGDFYSAAYIRKWIQICRRCPEVVFYAYTRSWAKNRLMPALEDLRRVKNMQLWWSTDKTRDPAPEGRVAYMSVDDNDLPIEGTSLVFRVKRSTKRRKMGGVPVCPKENGHPAKGLTCEKCKICFRFAITD